MPTDDTRTPEALREAKPWHDGMTLVQHADGSWCWHRPPQWLDEEPDGHALNPDHIETRGVFDD